MSLQTLYSNYKWLSDNVIERIIEILSRRTKNNPLLTSFDDKLSIALIIKSLASFFIVPPTFHLYLIYFFCR